MNQTFEVKVSEGGHLFGHHHPEQLFLEAHHCDGEVKKRDLNLHLWCIVRIRKLRPEKKKYVNDYVEVLQYGVHCSRHEELEAVVVRDHVVANLHHLLASLFELLLQ
jgi:hypothetical protein